MRTEVPCDFRTFVLSFLAGSALSLPLGVVFALTKIRPFTPPEWTEPYYFTVVLASFLILPFWSHFAFQRQPLLRRLGFTVFLLVLSIWVLGCLLSPAIST